MITGPPEAGMMPLKISPAGSRGATLTDVIIVLVALVLVGGGLLPRVTCRSRETANRVKCASQLKQVAQALLAYAGDNGGAFPRGRWYQSTSATTHYSGFNAQDTFAPAVLPNDVTAALFMLVRGTYATPNEFYCPSADATPWNVAAGNVTTYANFPGRAHLSYGINNPYMPEKFGHRWDNARSAEYAVAADMSPGGVAMSTVPVTASAAQMRAVNSPNHDRDGQCVLFGDAHVEFLQNPFVGVQRDNVFTAAANPLLQGVWIDSHILPTFLDGPQPPPARWRYMSGHWPLVWLGMAGLLIAAVLIALVARVQGERVTR
jgi:hypothetical protein